MKTNAQYALVAAMAVALFCAQCGDISLNGAKESSDDQVLGLTTGLTLSNSQDLVLNGSWNSFTGNGTSTDTITTIIGREGSGLWLDDSSGFGGYTSRYLIAGYSNSEGYVITQNPPNNGAYTGDTNKGKYFKIVFFADGQKYWHCTLNGTAPADSLDAAKAIADTSDRSDPGSTGCVGFSWSRLELRS